ncbi:hypothetical protein ACVWYQ_006248 [Bradyrhizobium sp. USDA 3397]
MTTIVPEAVEGEQKLAASLVAFALSNAGVT